MVDFKKATDALFDRVTHDQLAEYLGVSVPAVRQARLGRGATAYRNPPEGWEKAVRALAEGRIKHLERLIRALE